MPQLWIETFVSQYFWLLLILFTFYYFMVTKVVPIISETLKARQLTETKETNNAELETPTDTDLFNFAKLNVMVQDGVNQFANVQNEWIAGNPEEENQYIVTTSLTNETLENLLAGEDQLETLEEFVAKEEQDLQQ